MNELSIIVPCLSSAEMLPDFIDDLVTRYVRENPSDNEIIVVINGKVKINKLVLSHVKKNYPWLKFRMLKRAKDSASYGALVRFGLAYSTSRYAVFVSPYGEDDIRLIPHMLSALRKGAQVAQANRFSSHEDVNSVSLKFRIYQYAYRSLVRLFIGFGMRDSTYGFKMFDRVFIQSLGLMQNGYSICPEIRMKALLAGGKVNYIPSKVYSAPLNKNFMLHREWLGYLWLIARGFLHRIGILWF